MALPVPTEKYSIGDQAQLRREVERMDNENWKRLKDIDLGQTRLIITDAATGTRYRLVVTAGVLSAVAV